MLKFWARNKGEPEKARLSREQIVIGVFTTLILLLLGLFLFDAYIYYQTHIVKLLPSLSSSPKVSTTSERDLDQIIKILDERKTKFNIVLSGEKVEIK